MAGKKSGSGGPAEKSGEQRTRGRPFPKGQSGNPGGRPKVIAQVREAAQAKGVECIAKLWEIACNGDKDAARVAAIREILDRGFGRPAQAIEVSGPEGGPVRADLTPLDSDDLLKLREIASKLDGGGDE